MFKLPLDKRMHNRFRQPVDGRCQVLVSVAEHHSNLVPWQLACQRTGATLRHVPLTPDTQELDMQVSLRPRMHSPICLLSCLCCAVLAVVE